MSGQIILHHAAPSRSSTALFMLEEIGAPYEIAPLDWDAGDFDSPAFRAVNPIGLIPATRDPALLALSIMAQVGQAWSMRMSA